MMIHLENPHLILVGFGLGLALFGVGLYYFMKAIHLFVNTFYEKDE